MRRGTWLVLAAGGAGSSPRRETQATPALPAPACAHVGDVRVRGACLNPTGERGAAPALARVIAAMHAEPPGLGTPLALPDGPAERLGSRAAPPTFRDLESNLRVTVSDAADQVLSWHHPSEGSS